MLSMIVGGLMDLMITALGALSTDVLGLLGSDLEYAESQFPGLATFSKYMVYLGVVMIFVYGVSEAFLLISQPFTGIERKPPLTMVTRILFWTFMCWYSVDIGKIILNFFDKWYKKIMGLDASSGASNFATGLKDVMNKGAASELTGILGLILVIVLFISWIKIILQAVQRYLQLAFTVYTAPICLASGVMGEDTGVKAGLWFKMLIGNVIAMILTAWGVKVLIEAPDFMDAADPSGIEGGLVARILFMIGWVQVISKIDEFINKLGFNVVDTARGLGEAVTKGTMGVLRFGEHAGKTVSGIAKGRNQTKMQKEAAQNAAGDTLNHFTTNPTNGKKTQETYASKYAGNPEGFLGTEESHKATQRFTNPKAKRAYEDEVRKRLGGDKPSKPDDKGDLT